MKFVLVAIFHLLALMAFPQSNLVMNWARSLSNTPIGGGVGMASIALGANGDFYVAGNFSLSIDVDPGLGVSNLTSNGSVDIFFARYTALGQLVYARSIGGTGGDYVTAIAVDGEDNVYITGYFSGNADFDPGTGIANLSSIGDNDIYLAKYDASGNYIYAFNLGSGSDDRGLSVAVDASGAAYITGYFRGVVDFNPNSGWNPLASNDASADIFLAKYDASGNYLFAIGMGGISFDAGTAVKLDGDGNAYLTGSFNQTVDFDYGINEANLVSSGASDIFIAKYDAAGNYIFAKNMGGLSNEAGNSLALSASGEIFITGYFTETADFDPGPGSALLTSNGNWDIFVARYDASGGFINAFGVGSLSSDQALNIGLDASGHVFITGEFRGMLDFDPGPDENNLISAGQTDIFLAKFTLTGNLVFAIKMGSTNSDKGAGLGVDASGGVYLAGDFYNTVDFDPGPGVFNLSVPVNNVMNGFIARYGSSGSLLWAGPIGQYSNTVANSEARAVKLDADGNVYVAGFFRGVVDFDPGAGVAYLSSAGNTDGFLAKYDAQGNYIFAFRIGATSEDRVNAIEIDAGGNVLLIGQFQGQIDVDPGPDEFLLTSNGDNDIFLAKYSSSGNLIFAKNMGGASGDVVNDIALNDNGEIYLTGYFMGTSDFNPGPGTANLVSSGNTDIFLAKYDANGNYVYALSIGSSSADIGFSIEVDAAGAAYISGYYSGTVDFDPGPGSTLLSSLFNNDAFFAKFDTDGNFVYAKSIAGPGSEIAYSIAVSDNGMVYLTGYFDNQIDLDPGPGASNYTSVNSFDIFFAKYDASGDYIFGNTIGSSLDDRGHQIAVDNDGNIYLTGNLGLTADFDPGPGTANLTSLGQGDIFVAKYDDAGNYKYARRMGGTLNDRGYSIDVGSEGKVVIAGFFSGSATFNPESSDVTLRSLNGTDIYLAHYSESGSISTGTLSHSICLGASINVPFTVSYPLNSGNVFSAQLSNASGSFAAPINIGSLAATGSGSISATIPEATVAGTGYRIRVVSSSPAVTGTDNGADISIQLCCANPTNGGTIASNQTICHGETPAMLTSSAPASGHTGTLEYKWQYTTSDPDDPGFDPTSWTDINASNATTYQPDAITQTTWYRRLARVDCVLGWGNAVASNVVSVTVSTARIHVTVSGAGLMDGSSWANAMSGSQLQAAINASCVTEVWVAAGTYQPALNTSFSMKEGVAILGGFPNTGNPGLAERNYAANATILQGNGTRVINNTNNGLTNAAILDGFTITGGTASGSSGPGALNINVSPTFRNCIFTGNSGYWDGSLYFQHGTAIVDNCIFIGNTASVFSGGLRLSWNGSATSPKITNCSFSGNTGPGIHINPGASPFIHNCVIWGNGSGIFAGINSSPTVTHSIVQGGFTGTGNLDIDPLFINQPVIGLGSSGDLRLQTCSPAINAGDNAAVPAGITRDLDNNPRFYNSGTVDMGAYELQAVPASYPTNGGTIASSQSLCSGSTPAQLTSSAPASGQTGTLEYKWQYTTSDPDDAGFDPASWSDIASSNAATFQPGALSQTTWYRRLARVDCGLDWSSAAASNTILITVDPAPFASVVTYPSGFVLGFNPSAWSTNFSVDGAVFFNGTNTLELMAFASYDASAGATVTIPLTGTISFSWQYDASMSPPVNEAFGFVLNGIPVQLTDFWNNNQNGVVSALPVNEGDEFGFWLSSQTNGVGSTMAVINGFSFQPTSYSVTVCNTGSYTLESSVASASNGTILWTHNGSGQLEFATTLQPKYTPSLADGGNVVTLTLSVTSQNACSPATAAAQYGLLIQNCCANPTSGGTIASNQTLCSGSTPALLTSSAPASGHTGTLEYKWQYTTSDPSGAGFDPLSWADIASSNSATYQPDALTQINWFRRLARVDCESDWSSAVASNVVRVAIVPEHIFITENGAGLMDGSSWANAMPGTAIQEALDNSVCNNVIWVAKGRYVPTTEIGGGGTRFRSFSMKPGVQLLGGFSGNEDPLSFDISTRDFETNETILDGDINGDDEVTGEDTNFTLNNYGDNTHRVVLFRDDLVFTNSTIIDGFTIRGGNSNIPLVGGAIHIDRASPLLRNLVIKESTAHSDDGAVRVLGGSPVFENCLFTRNLHNMVIQSRNWGVPSALISNVTINNSTFRQNKSNSGGAIYLRNFAKLQMDNCLLEQNEATGHEGGAIFINNSEAQITNTIIRNNTAYTAGGGISFMYPNMIDYGIRKRLVLQNVDLIDNITGSAMGGGLSASNVAELSFVKGVIEGNIANNDRSSYYSGGGGIFINAEPNAIINLDGLKINNHTIPFGYGGGLYIAPFSSSAGYDLSLKNSKITNNYAPNSGGIALAGTVGVRDLENLLISGNQAISIGGIWSAKSNTVFKNVTITRNISQQSAVIFAFSPQLINSIVWDNTVIQWPHWHSFEPSLVINSTIHNEPGMYPTPLALSGIDMSDPLFVNPDMGDFRLMQGSPLIDQGNNSYSTVDFDVRGAGFPRRIDRSNAGALGTVDRGAFEFNIDTDCILPTDGGTIGASQVICSGSVPVLLNSLSVVGPAYGPVTYKWQSTTSNPSSPGFDPESWTDIASSNSITYQPDALTQTTWFRRLAKVDCAPGWSGAAASNIVQITAQTLTLNMAGQMPAGLGTSSNPYLIANFDNLLWLTANPSAWDKHFLQTADIDALVTSNACFNNGAGWSPIGILGQPFQGTYDGDYHTISNVFIHLPAQSRVGFFGATGFDAHINRLSLINAQVTGGNRTGLMLGELRGTVFQSGATGMVSGGDFTGGFAGIIESGLPVSQSFANANVSATGTAGGFAGYAHATISDCYAVGTLNINGNQSGGFLGAIYGGEAVRSYSAMNANVISSGWTGGFVAALIGPQSVLADNFFDNDIHSPTVSFGATPKTTLDMTMQSTFTNAGWDFSLPIWGMNPDINNSYPHLSWQDRWAGELIDLPIGTIVYDDTWQWNGTPLEWIFVEKQVPVMYETVLMARQHIHVMPYRTDLLDNNYEQSSVRHYLNTDFYGSFSHAFKSIGEQRSFNWASSFSNTIGQQGYVVDVVFLPAVSELGGPILSPILTRTFSYFSGPEGHIRRASAPGFQNMTRSGIFQLNPPANQRIYYIDILGAFYNDIMSTVTAPFAVRPAMFVQPYTHFVRQPDGRYKLRTHRVLYTATDGTINGTADQQVAHGRSGEQVTAVPNAGYKFVSWSDGNTNPQRTENNVTATRSLHASFEPCQNPDNGGLIGNNQFLCLGTEPQLLSSIADPSGYMGTIEYQWQYTYSDPEAPGFDPASWVNIPSTNTNTYQPVAVVQTTWYRRIAGLTCDPEKFASNVVKIEVSLYEISATAEAIEFSYACGANETLTVSENAGSIVFDVSGRYFSLNGGAPQLFPATLLLSEVNQITINAGLGNDVINVGNFASQLPNLTINGGQGNDVVNFGGDITFMPDANLDVDLQNDHASPGEDIVNIAANANLIFQGSGSPVIKLSKWMTIDTGGSIEVVDGNLIIEVNQQTPTTIGNFHGLIIPGLLRTTGQGDIIVKSTAGKDATGFMVAFWMHTNGRIESTANEAGKGNIFITATVKDGYAGGASGLQIRNNSSIFSAGGDIRIDGHVGSGYASSVGTVGSNGMSMYENGSITATGPAAIHINLSSGDALLGSNYAFDMRAAGAKITSVDGDITINAESGGGNANPNFVLSNGAFITSGAFIETTGTGNITLTAQSGQVITAGSGSQSLRLDAPSYVRSSNGNIHISATNINNFSGTTFNHGSSIRGNVSSTGTGNIIIEGAAGIPNAVFASGSQGVQVRNGATVSSAGGNITIRGTADNTPGNEALTIARVGNGTVSIGDPSKSITFEGNSMDIHPSNGTVNAGSGTVVLKGRTAGHALDLGGADATGILGLSDDELDRVTAGTLVLGGQTSGGITVSSNISRSAATNMQLISNEDILFTGGGINTSGGTLMLNPGDSPAAVYPDYDGTDATVSTLSFGSDLGIIINGNIPGDGTGSTYTQLTVQGNIDLTGVDLVLSGTHTPAANETFVIVNNTGDQPIISTFNSIPEGGLISDVLGSGLTGLISYTGGDGNDVVLTLCSNPINGGIIADNQTICFNTAPSIFTSTGLPTGHAGTLEYKWQYTTSDPDDPGFDPTSWTDINASNATTYQPGALTLTTWYRRLARVDCSTDWSGASASNTIKVTVRPQFTPGAIATTGETICYGGTPGQIGSVTTASGGDQTITYSWRSSEDNYTAAISGATASTYTPPAGLSTTTTYRRYAKDGSCNTTPEQSAGEWTVTVRPQFTPGAIATTGETICYGGTPSQIGNVTTASGGDQTITYSWRSSEDNYTAAISGATASTYTPPAGLSTTTTYRRYAKDGSCNTTPEQSAGEWTVTVRPQFTPGAIATTGETICYGGTPGQIGSVTTASGGDQNITYSWRSSADNYTAAISGATASSYTPPAGLTTTTTYRRYAKDGSCNTTPEQSAGEWTVTVEPTPLAGVFNSNPAAFTTVCEGTLVWATLDGNTGGNGTDQTEYRVFTPTSYSVWMPYDGSPLSTSGLLFVELRSRRLSDYCSHSPWIYSGWTVEPTPVSGILQRQPDVAMVCEGSPVQAMLMGADGGNWTDQTEYRSRTTGGWSSWMPYAGTAINTTGLLEVEIRSRRLADYCQPSAYTTVKWDVETTPVSGILTASPAQALVCEGTEVSAQLQPGAGGNGVDVTEYRTKQNDSWSSWMPCASGQFLSTLGIQRIELRTVRTASVCSNAMANTVSWDIEQPAQAGSLIKTPMQAMVCEGSVVSALLQTPGTGGNGTDQAVYRSRSGAVWSGWMSYTFGTPLSTSGLDEIEIGTRRLATACPSSDYQTVIWQVEPTSVAFAGNNAVSCSNQAFTLQAQAFHATGYQWSSSGDGSFSNPTELNPEYMPGPQDKASGTVTLTLTVNTQGLCQVSSSMTLTLTQPVSPVVTVTPNVQTVCSGTPVQYAAIYQHAGSSPVFVWKVNGQAVPGSGPNFAYIPQQGDAVSVEMTTSLGCVTQTTVQSNIATVNVVPISLNLSTNPVAGGQASYTGQLALGGAVQLSATPAFGYVFLHWTDQSGQVVGTTPELQYTLQTCITALTANFVPGATLSGYLKFYNPIESPVSATGAHFMAQLFKDNAAVSVPQPFNADGYYSFSPIIQGGGYTLRVWEQPPVNQLSSTWMWNNWAGVSGLDGLIVSFMATEQPLSQAFPWIQPVHNVPYTPFAVTTADVNNTSTITANDALTILYRSVQGSAFGTFPGNRHNFILSASRLTNPSVMRYPQAPELMFEPFGMYQAAQPASQVYYEVDPGAMTAGNNYMNIYLTAAGDMNASYLPGNNLKTTASLLYEGTMQKKAGDAFDLPVFLTSEVLLGAATIGLRYDSEMLEVKQVRGATVQHIDDKEGVVRTAWYDTRGMMFDPSMPVLNLSVVLRREPGVGSRYLELLPETEFADVDARVIDKLQLRTLSLTGQDNATGEVAINHQVVPNPFTDQARLSFSLPEQGRVTVMIYNQFGQLVKQLAEQQFRAGQHSINIHKKDLIHSGTYYYQLHHDTGSKSTVVSGKLIMIR